MERRRCAIVGAGGSGIAGARWAIAYGIEPVVFEKNDDIGGLWRYDPEQKQYGSVMRTTTANTSKEMTAYSDFPPHESKNIYMHNTELLEYMREYVKHHSLYQYIKFRHTIIQIRRAVDYDTTGKWQVEYCDAEGNTQSEIFDAVLCCYGNVTPNRKGIERKNQSRFSGRILHACEIKNTDDFTDKINVVVGFAASASDIASELGRVSKKVYLSTRSGGRLILRADENGQPLDMFFLRRFDRYVLPKILPIKWRELFFIRQFQAHIDHVKLGLVNHKDGLFSKNIVMNNDLPSQILTGAVSIRPDILEYTEHGVIFTKNGGSIPHVDNVIFATGYLFETNLIENGNLIPLYENNAFLYKHIFPPQTADHNTLGIIGIQNLFGSLLPTVEMQCRVFFDQLAGFLKLPSQDQMIRIMDTERTNAFTRAAGKPLKTALGMDGMIYLDELADLIGCRPNIWKTILQGDFRLAWAIAFGPNAAYSYRIFGTHNWPDARDALLNLQRRVDFPLYSFTITTCQSKENDRFNPTQIIFNKLFLLFTPKYKIGKKSIFLNVLLIIIAVGFGSYGGSSITTAAAGITVSRPRTPTISLPPVFDERRIPPAYYEPGSGAEFMVRSGYHLHDQYGQALNVNNDVNNNQKKNLHLSTTRLLQIRQIFVVNTVKPLYNNGSYLYMPNAEILPSVNDSSRFNTHASITPTLPYRPQNKNAIISAVDQQKTAILDSDNKAIDEVELKQRPAPRITALLPHRNEYSHEGPSDTLSSTVTHSTATRTFECELYILQQKNDAYDDIQSFEYRQAIANIYDALNGLSNSPIFENKRPTINIIQIENSGNDLCVIYHISIELKTDKDTLKAIDEKKIRNALLADLPRIESTLNNVELDRTRIIVNLVNDMRQFYFD